MDKKRHAALNFNFQRENQSETSYLMQVPIPMDANEIQKNKGKNKKIMKYGSLDNRGNVQGLTGHTKHTRDRHDGGGGHSGGGGGQCIYSTPVRRVTSDASEGGSPKYSEMSPYLSDKTRNAMEFIHLTPRMASFSPGVVSFAFDKETNEEIDNVRIKLTSPNRAISNESYSGGHGRSRKRGGGGIGGGIGSGSGGGTQRSPYRIRMMETLEQGADSPHRAIAIEDTIHREETKEQPTTTTTTTNTTTETTNTNTNTNENNKTQASTVQSTATSVAAAASLVTASTVTLMCLMSPSVEYNSGIDIDDSSSRVLLAVSGDSNGNNVSYWISHNLLLIGRILGWFSTIIYISSRIPQLKMTIETKDVANISPYLFVLTFFGNAAQCLSMLIRKVLWHDLNIVLSQLPWLLSSGLCMFQDAAIVILIFAYTKQHENISKTTKTND